MTDRIFGRFGYTKGDVRHIALYSLAMAGLVFLLKWLQWKYLIADNSLEVYIALIAVFFTVLGTWIATQLARPKVRTVFVEKEVYVERVGPFPPDEVALAEMNLSSREQEVLALLLAGCTNAEIAGRLCLSVSTVKTHVSNLFLKMDVRNRIQAVEKARRLKVHHATR